MDNISLDTHSLIWYIRGTKTLSKTAKLLIDQIFLGKFKCYISTMAVLEAYYVSLRDRSFDFTKFLKMINIPNLEVVSFDKIVLEQSFELPKDMDIHDRIIVATAVVTNTPLVTKDKTLRKLFPNETIW